MGRSLKDGFSLLEIIIALAVFGMAMVTLGGAYINTISSMDRVQVDQGLEQDLNLVRMMALTKETIEELEDGGEIQSGSHGELSWSAEYEPTAVADLFEVILIIEYEDLKTEQMRELTQTLFLTRPTWSDATEREALRAETRENHLNFLSGLQQ